MTSTAITILGLGPGSISDLTLQAYNLLEQAAHNGQTVYFRTVIHPTVDALKQDIPDLQIASFDQLYDESADWGALYQQIAEKKYAVFAGQEIFLNSMKVVIEAGTQISLKVGGNFIDISSAGVAIPPAEKFGTGRAPFSATSRISSIGAWCSLAR